MQHHVLVVPGERPPGRADRSASGTPSSRSRSTSRLWARIMATCICEIRTWNPGAGRPPGRRPPRCGADRPARPARSGQAAAGPGRAAVQVGIGDRPLPVQQLQVEPSAAGVPEQLRVVVVGQRRAVGGQIVGQVLAEHRPPGGDRASLRGAVVGGVAGPAGPADGPQQLRLDRQRRQLGEQPGVAAAGQGAPPAAGARQWSRTCRIAQPPRQRITVRTMIAHRRMPFGMGRSRQM